MALSYVASATAQDSSALTAVLTIAVPAGTADGDVMIAYIGKDGATSESFDTPAGWNLVSEIKDSGSRQTAVLFWRAASSEPANYTFTWTAANNKRSSGIIATFRGVHNTSPIAAYSDNEDMTVDTAMNFDGITVGSAAHMLVACVSPNCGSQTFSAPSGYTLTAEASNTSGLSSSSSVAMAHKADSGANPSGGSFTASDPQQNVAHHLALQEKPLSPFTIAVVIH